VNASSKKTAKSRRPVVYDMGAEKQCIYAQAGIVRPTLCLNAFDCLTCPLDKKIQQDKARGTLTDEQGRPSQGWRDPQTRINTMAGQKWCRHMLSGLVDYKICPYNYDCARCPYDQMIADTEPAHPTSVTSYAYAAGVALGRNHYYHDGHAWARVEYGGQVRLGLDDFCLRLLGCPDGLDLPSIGHTVQQGEKALSLHRKDHLASFLSPVSGIIVARNPGVLREPDRAHESPYDVGWLLVIQPTKLKDNLRRLHFGDEAAAWMETEVSRLVEMVTHETGEHMLSTGGRMIDDVFGEIPELGWDRLVHEFLRT
jgi:glycine cleavage system H lipoate-binding protein